jgi:hypothetical protein
LTSVSPDGITRPAEESPENTRLNYVSIKSIPHNCWTQLRYSCYSDDRVRRDWITPRWIAVAGAGASYVERHPGLGSSQWRVRHRRVPCVLRHLERNLSPDHQCGKQNNSYSTESGNRTNYYFATDYSAVGVESAPSNQVSFNAGLNTTTPPASPAFPVLTNFITYSGDFNGDGNRISSGEIHKPKFVIWYMDGAAIGANDYVDTVSRTGRSSQFADFNGDGFLVS